jgi:hypothetical protein
VIETNDWVVGDAIKLGSFDTRVTGDKPAVFVDHGGGDDSECFH